MAGWAISEGGSTFWTHLHWATYSRQDLALMTDAGMAGATGGLGWAIADVLTKKLVMAGWEACDIGQDADVNLLEARAIRLGLAILTAMRLQKMPGPIAAQQGLDLDRVVVLEAMLEEMTASKGCKRPLEAQMDFDRASKRRKLPGSRPGKRNRDTL